MMHLCSLQIWCSSAYPILRTKADDIVPPRKKTGWVKLFWATNYSAANCRLLLKFGMRVHYGYAKVVELLNLYWLEHQGLWPHN